MRLVITVYVEAVTNDGVVSFDQFGDGGVVVGDGPGSLERQLEFDFDGVWVVLEGLLDGPLRRSVKGQVEEAFHGFVWRWIDVGVGVSEYFLEALLIEWVVRNPFGDRTFAPR